MGLKARPVVEEASQVEGPLGPAGAARVELPSVAEAVLVSQEPALEVQPVVEVVAPPGPAVEPPQGSQIQPVGSSPVPLLWCCWRPDNDPPSRPIGASRQSLLAGRDCPVRYRPSFGKASGSPDHSRCCRYGRRSAPSAPASCSARRRPSLRSTANRRSVPHCSIQRRSWG